MLQRYIKIALCVGMVWLGQLRLLQAEPAVFQYAVPTMLAKDKTSTALLWLPAQAPQIRGIVLAGMTSVEREVVKNPLIRQACGEQQLAIVFLKSGLSGPDLQIVLNDLAKVSGYPELAVAPLFFIGHSAGGPQAQENAVKFAPRCFGLLQDRGGGPYSGKTPLPAGIPSLMLLGQYDEFGGVMRDAQGGEHWDKITTELADFRAADEARLCSIYVEPGAGHFSWSARNSQVAAEFIRAAATSLIPKTWDIQLNQPPALNRVTSASGWLSELPQRGTLKPPVAYADYQGDKTRANWHLTEALAKHWLGYQSGMNKQDQFIQWNDPHWAEAGSRLTFTAPEWVDDGQTFLVHPAFAPTYPGPGPTTAPATTAPAARRWAGAGTPVGHAPTPIQLRVTSGTLVAVGGHKLRVQCDNLAPFSDVGRMIFVAYNEGDARYRYTEVGGFMPKSFKGFKQGQAQTLTFPPLVNMKPDSAPQTLAARSDAGLPVEYYVAKGPAVITDGKLKLAEIPVRASYPIAITVVAYQMGRGCAPLIQTAQPVEQTILLEKS